MDCLFCKIGRGEIPSEKIYEDGATFAFLDIHPVNRGHTLVIPKKHSENIFDIDQNDWSEVMKRVHMLAPKVRKAVGAEGVNIGMNNDCAAGQLVFHVHVHIIPRFTNDGHQLWHGNPYKEGEIEATAEAMRDAIGKIDKALRFNG